MSLNRAQYEAVAHREGPCMVLAGPGSGKTLTIVKRIEYLIKKYKVRPEEILVITFTKYAAGEMRGRFGRITKEAYPAVTFGTFHGIYYGILKWEYHLNPGCILAEEEKLGMIAKAVEKIKPDRICEPENQEGSVRELAAEIGSIKNNRLNVRECTLPGYEAEEFFEIYQAYEAMKRQLGRIDFEDMLVMCLELFQKRPDILSRWQDKFRYILIDEFQDINQIQYDVIRMLAAPRNNLFVVGDDDQSVYGFRGARPQIMIGFMRDYPGANKIVLNVNYRSGADIVKSAGHLIVHNEKRYEKNIRAGRADGERVEINEAEDPWGECLYVIDKVKKCKEAGVVYRQMAVLGRTALDLRLLTELLMEYQVPFTMKERQDNIYEHFVGKDIRSYLSLAFGSRERGHFLRILNRPNRYIGRESMADGEVSFQSLREYYRGREQTQDKIDRMEWDIRALKGMPPYLAIQYIRKSIGYDNHLENYASYRKVSAQEWMQVLEQIQESARACRNIEEWLKHVEDYTQLLKEKKNRKQPAGDGISLMTMHGAKGLEYDTVFLIGANEGTIPHKKAAAKEETEEERRLFYVAMTRAKRKLYISYVKEKNGKSAGPSRFIQELQDIV